MEPIQNIHFFPKQILFSISATNDKAITKYSYFLATKSILIPFPQYVKLVKNETII